MSKDEGMMNVQMTNNMGCCLSASIGALSRVRQSDGLVPWRVWRIIVPLLLCVAAIPARADTITVTNTNDSGSGSLRQALADANDGDTIDFAVSGTIGLTSGELFVDKSITISGPGAKNLAVDGNAKSRVFHIGTGEIVTISDLTITNGHSTGLSPDVGGAGIYNDHAMLTVDNCAFTGNTVDVSGDISAGGAIFNDGSQGGSATLTISSSTLNNNSARDGGGIYNAGYNDGGVTVDVSNSTLSGNTAGAYGGGMESVGLFGQANSVLVTFDNSTLSGNAAALDGDAISNVDATVELSNSILNGQPSGEQIFNLQGVVMSHGYNLSSADDPRFLTGPGDQINTDPLLGPLRSNGGPTLTQRPFPGSLAIEGGDPSFTPPPLYDQRGPGFNRVVNGRLDIGAFEVQSGKPPPPPRPRPRPTPHPRPTP
jgi:hypothetical protein